ncbi:MAG: peptide chain release factor N(5)-glutamine methyltransferase [Planctomycetota bacterium]|nr:peptide chain release factor N(5)-glutamine methyltransferase [Planctomycetota bacterium]
MPPSSQPEPPSTTREAPWTVRRLLDWIRNYLGDRDVDSPRVCAELLLAHVLDCDRLRLYMTPDHEPTAEQLATLRALVARAGAHEPVQYLVGSWPFHGREFEVSPVTLIPRPSSELLVDRAFGELRDRGLDREWTLLDLCTGTGCIGISLLALLDSTRRGPISQRSAPPPTDPPPDPASGSDEDVVFDLDLNQRGPSSSRPAEVVESSTPTDRHGELRMVATDIDPEILRLAARNAGTHGVEGFIEFREGSLFDPLADSERGTFDVICANPPYVSDAEYEALDRNVRDYEPARALRGGADGLQFVRPILHSAPDWLAPGGLLLVELATASADQVLEEARRLGVYDELGIEPDHEDLPRMLFARRTS